VRLQLSSAWPPGWGTGPQPRSGGQAGEVGEAANCRTTRGQARGRSDSELVGDGTDQALVAREAEDVVDVIRLAPRHQLVAGKARIGAQQDADPGPAGTDLADDAGHFILGAGGRIDVRAPEFGRQQVPAAEHVQRQIAVAVVIAVEEAALLVAV
jgi:hypothetical protein